MSTQVKLHHRDSRTYCWGGLILPAAAELTSVAVQAAAHTRLPGAAAARGPAPRPTPG